MWRGLATAATNATTICPGSRDEACPAKVLVVSSPGAVIGYFAEAAALTDASPTGQPDMARLAALAAEYGIEFVG